MGAPRKQKRKFERPKRPYDKDRIAKEKKIRTAFGLKRKHEIWHAESVLREWRTRARELLGRPDPKKQEELLVTLSNLGLNVLNLDDILELNADAILARRLQTLVYKKGLASTPHHARQLIVHKHVLVAGRKIAWPSWIVPASLEDKIDLDAKSKAKALKQEETV